MNSRNKLDTNARSEEVSLKYVFISLINWYHYLVSKWVSILIAILIGAMIAFAMVSMKAKLYVATTTFVLEEDNSSSSLGGLGGLASMVGINVGGGGNIFQGDNILQLYSSRSIIKKVLLTKVNYEGKDLLLIDQYIAFNKLRDQWAKDRKLDKVDFNFGNVKDGDLNTRLKDSIISAITEDINKNLLTVSKPDRKLSIIKAEVKAQDEFFAKTFNEKIVEIVSDFYIQTKTKKSLDNVNILQQKTDSVRRMINGAINKAAAVADATPNLNITRQMQRTAPVQRLTLSAESNKEILGELIKNLELSKISLRKETPLIQIIDSPIYPLNIQSPSRIKYIFVGSLLSGIIFIIALIIRMLIKNILTSDEKI